MWKSHVEIEGYSVACFDRIAVLEAPYRWASIKGGAHTCFVATWISNESMKRIWTSPLTEVQWYSASKACGITFDFYTGLPHMYNTQLPSMTSMWHRSGVLNKRIFSSSTQTSEHAIQLYKLMHHTFIAPWWTMKVRASWTRRSHWYYCWFQLSLNTEVVHSNVLLTSISGSTGFVADKFVVDSIMVVLNY